MTTRTSGGSDCCEPRALVEDFLATLARQHAASTCRSYRYDLDEFLSWCERVGVSALAAETSDVQDYVANVLATVSARTAGPPVAAARRRLAALARFYEHAVARGCCVSSPVVGVELSRPVAQQGEQLSTADVGALLAAAAAHSARSHALVALLAGAGLRLGEALTRDVDDLILDGGTVVLRFHRSARIGTVDIPIEWPLFQILSRYLDGRNHGPLFSTRTGGRLDQPSVWRLVRQLARTAELPQQDHINPHSLREFYIAAKLQSGKPAEEVQAAAGYTHPNSLRPYARD